MRQVIGAMLIVIGLLPVVAVLWFWLWAHRMYTVGLSIDAKGFVVLIALVLVDLFCLGGGLYLLCHPRRAAA